MNLTVAQVKALSDLVAIQHLLPNDRAVILVKYINGKFRARFMGDDGTVFNYWINHKGETKYEALEGS